MVKKLLKKGFDKFTEKLQEYFLSLGGFQKFSDVVIKESVMKKICSLSKDVHPKEFLAFFEGRVENERLVITDILFQPYDADEESASAHINFPTLNNVVGSIHSHPGRSNKPSSADKHFFHKTGIVHGIVRYPYQYSDLTLYNNDGEPLEYSTV